MNAKTKKAKKAYDKRNCQVPLIILWIFNLLSNATTTTAKIQTDIFVVASIDIRKKSTILFHKKRVSGAKKCLMVSMKILGIFFQRMLF